jgi:hypothetical protein
VVGLSEDCISAVNSAFSVNGNTQIARETAIGLDATNVGSVGHSTTGWIAPTNTFTQPVRAFFAAKAPLGFHYIAPLEWSAASGTTTWYGDNGGTEFLSNFLASLPG